MACCYDDVFSVPIKFLFYQIYISNKKGNKGSVNYASFSLGQTNPTLGRRELTLTLLTRKLNRYPKMTTFMHFGQLKKNSFGKSAYHKALQAY